MADELVVVWTGVNEHRDRDLLSPELAGEALVRLTLAGRRRLGDGPGGVE